MKSEAECKVSIIVPVLNGEKTIRRCLDSLVCQTSEGIEILVVDAHSDDNTEEIVLEYAKRNPNVRILISDIRSYGYQVNYGISEASGKYIGIVEPDDTASPGMFDRLFAIAEDADVDFVKADYFDVFRKEKKSGAATKRYRYVLQYKQDYGIILSPTEYPRCFLPDVVAIWSGLYRREFLRRHHIRLNETLGASFQDTGFYLQTNLYAKRAVFINKAFYEYTADNAESSVFQPNKWRCLNDEMRFAMRDIFPGELAEKLLSPKVYERLYYLFYRKYRRNAERVSEDEKEEFYRQFADNFKEWENRYGRMQMTEFTEEEKEDCSAILMLREQYVKRAQREKEKFLRECTLYNAVLIYGAGRVGHILQNELAENANIVGVMTTETIEEVARDDELRKTGAVIVASKISTYRVEMEKKAKEMGFKIVIKTPFESY